MLPHGRRDRGNLGLPQKRRRKRSRRWFELTKRRWHTMPIDGI
jgi:hypothetical protein